MTKSAAKVLKTVPRTSRRAQYSASTKRALVDVAGQLFTEQGYAGTSLDEIVAGARVTKGALYHHFSGKQAIFEAAFERVESRATAGIAEAAEGHRDPWEKAQAGLRAFLAAVQEPGYRQIVISDGPSVLGHERFREQEERSTYAIVDEVVRAVLTADGWDLDEDMLDTFTRIFFGAMSAAGGSVAVSEDPAAAAARVEVAIGVILTGLQRLLESSDGTTDGAAGGAAGGVTWRR
jgi:AcrR family transcriptional regulator